jgi:plasmid maintenance system antidote protein VapI
MHDTDLTAEKARIWRKSIQSAGISTEEMGHFLGFTSHQMQGIWRGEITITPEMEIRMLDILSKVESERINCLWGTANKRSLL